MSFASRAGEKLDHALKTFDVNVQGFVCADFGSSTGGFVDCLLQHGAQKVYAVEKGYGQLDWKLRNDPRVIVMERTNVMHAKLPEHVNLITIDTSWTKLE
ncbi:MAG: SAM-dependent methyltransferase, partial [Bdellovibrionota bacterium]